MEMDLRTFQTNTLNPDDPAVVDSRTEVDFKMATKLPRENTPAGTSTLLFQEFPPTSRNSQKQDSEAK